MLLNSALGRNRDVLFEAHMSQPATAINANAEHVLFAVPNLVNSFGPSAAPGALPGGRQTLPINAIQLRQVIVIPEVTTAAAATNTFDYRVKLYRAGVLQGALAFHTMSVSTTSANLAAGAVGTAGAVQTIQVVSAAGIRAGQALLWDTAGNQEQIIVQAVNTSTPSVTAYFNKTHAQNVAVVSSILAWSQTPLVSCAGGVQVAATLPALTAGSNVVVTPNAVNGLSGMYGIHVGDQLLIDTVASGVQETVTVSAVTDTTFTIASLAHSHSASVPVSSAVLANQSQSALFAIQGGDVLTVETLNAGTGLASNIAVFEADWALSASPMGL